MSLTFQRLHNVRDLGGWPTLDGGVTRHGVLYRSDSLGLLDGADLERFRALGVRTVIDLRYPEEIAAAGRVPAEPGLVYHNRSIEHRPYDQTAVAADVDPAGFFAEKYAEVAADGRAEIQDVIRLIAGDAPAPLAFHCKSGKDRTGIIAALVLTLVGVDREHVVEEFALSNLATPRFHAEHLASGAALPAWPGFGTAPAGAIRAFLELLDSVHGGVPHYLDVDESVLRDLRSRLVG